MGSEKDFLKLTGIFFAWLNWDFAFWEISEYIFFSKRDLNKLSNAEGKEPEKKRGQLKKKIHTQT